MAIIADGVLLSLCAICNISSLIHSSKCTYCAQQTWAVYAQGILQSRSRVCVRVCDSVNIQAHCWCRRTCRDINQGQRGHLTILMFLCWRSVYRRCLQSFPAYPLRWLYMRLRRSHSALSWVRASAICATSAGEESLMASGCRSWSPATCSPRHSRLSLIFCNKTNAR